MRSEVEGWNDAVTFAVAHHGGALRKGTRVPYVTHVMAVTETLAYHYPERDALIVAGLLHDVVEDTDATFEVVEERFGPQVAALVRAVSKDDVAMEAALGRSLEEMTAGLDATAARAAVWRRRREFMLAHLRSGALDCGLRSDVLRLKAADALANLGAILRDLKHPDVGAAVWDRFKVGRDDSLWFYGEIVRAVEEGIAGEPLAAGLRGMFERVVARSGAERG
jgi:hypothetical protein